MKKFVAFMFCCGVLVAAGDVRGQNISIQNPSFENVPVPLGNNGFSALGTHMLGGQTSITPARLALVCSIRSRRPRRAFWEPMWCSRMDRPGSVVSC